MDVGMAWKPSDYGRFGNSRNVKRNSNQLADYETRKNRGV